MSENECRRLLDEMSKFNEELTLAFFNAVFQFKGYITFQQLIDKVNQYLKLFWNDDNPPMFIDNKTGDCMFYYNDKGECNRKAIELDVQQFFGCRFNVVDHVYSSKEALEFINSVVE